MEGYLYRTLHKVKSLDLEMFKYIIKISLPINYEYFLIQIIKNRYLPVETFKILVDQGYSPHCSRYGKESAFVNLLKNRWVTLKMFQILLARSKNVRYSQYIYESKGTTS